MGNASDNVLFSVRCVTCQARLAVRDPDLIGQIFACPKCRSMVLVEPPPGWKRPSPDTAPTGPASTEQLPAKPPRAATGPSAEQRTKTPAKSAGAVKPTGAPAAIAASAPEPPAGSTSQLPAESPPPANKSPGQFAAPQLVAATPPATQPPPEATAEEDLGEPADSGMELGGPIPQPRMPLGAKIAWIASGVLALGIIAFGLHMSLRSAPGPSTEHTDVTPQPADDEPSPAAPPTPAPPLPWEWAPPSAQAALAAMPAGATALADLPGWPSVVRDAWHARLPRVLESLRLSPNDVRAALWWNTQADFRGDDLVLLQLAEPNALRLSQAGPYPAADYTVSGAPVALLSGAWSQPAVQIDDWTIATGSEPLLRDLQARTTEPTLLQRALQFVEPQAALALAIDIRAYRAAHGSLPVPLPRSTPQAAEAWRTAWTRCEQSALAVALAVQTEETPTLHAAVVCESPSVADEFQAALLVMRDAARTALPEQRPLIEQHVQDGGLDAQSGELLLRLADISMVSLNALETGLDQQIAWLRIPLPAELASTAGDLSQAWPVIAHLRDELALAGDQSNAEHVLAAISSCVQAEHALPAGAGGNALLSPPTRLSWYASVLPYLGHMELYQRLNFARAWNDAANRPVAEQFLPELLNPALRPEPTEAGFAPAHYVGLAGIGPDAATLPASDPRAGVFAFDRRLRSEEITDGASNTIALLAVESQLGPWAQGGPASVRSLTQQPYIHGPDGFGSGRADRVLVGMADGSARWLSAEIDPAVLEMLATIAGAEPDASDLLAANQIDLTEPAIPADDPSENEDHPPGETPTEVADSGDHVPADEEVLPAPIDLRPPLPLVEVEARLAEPLPAVELRGVPLRDAVEFLSQFTGVVITLEVDGLAEAGVPLDDPVQLRRQDTTAGEVLQSILAERGLVWQVQDGQLHVTSRERAAATLQSNVLAVEDLASSAEDVAQLAELIEQTLAPESWQSAGGPGQIVPGRGQLEIQQTASVTRQVLILLDRLRRARGAAPRSGLEERFTRLESRNTAALELLETPLSLNFRQETSLRKVLDFLEQKTSCEFLLDGTSLAQAGLTGEAVVSFACENRPVRAILDELLTPLGLACRVIDERTLLITTRAALDALYELEVYPAVDLISEERTADALLAEVKTRVAPPTWDDAGGPARVRYAPRYGCLLVWQTQPTQQEVESLLDRLRPAMTEE